MQHSIMFGTEARKLARRDSPDTSKEAAAKLNPAGLEKEVYDVIANAGPRGVISDEVRAALPHVSSYSSVTARYKALKEKNLIVATAKKRPSKKRGVTRGSKNEKNLQTTERRFMCLPG